MHVLFALFDRPMAMWGVGDFLIFILIVAGCLGVAYIILVNVIGWTPPAWFFHVVWIVIGVFVGIFAIRLLMSM